MSQTTPAIDVETMIAAAERHGAESDPDHEVGDLQQILRAAWEIMTPEQRVALAADDMVQEVLDHLDTGPAPTP